MGKKFNFSFECLYCLHEYVMYIEFFIIASGSFHKLQISISKIKLQN